MSVAWSHEQREWLQALGYRVMVLAGDETVDVSSVVAADDGAPARESRVAEPARRRPAAAADRAPRVPPASLDAPPTPRATASPASNRLERALLRLSGQRTTTAAREVLANLGVDVDALRGDPAAKRALWPRLRPLQPRYRP